MHIPASMLHGAVCPVTVLMSAAGVAASVHAAQRSHHKPSIAAFGAVTTLVFAAQMLNFPVTNGTSGHLLGGVLAASLLGIPFAILSMASVLCAQAVFLGDGGIDALGANIFNMAIIGTGLCGFVLNVLRAKGLDRCMALGAASWLSVVLAALFCSIELAVSGTIGLAKALPAMLSVHSLIGAGEMVVAVALSIIIESIGRRRYALTSFGLAAALVLMIPFASTLPDGLQSVLQLFG